MAARRPRHERRRRPALTIAVAATVLVTAFASSRLGSPTPPPVRAQDFPPAMPAAGRIVYTRQATDTFDMFTADADGTNEARLSTINESAAGEDQPRWSPDATRLSFTTFRDSAAYIHVIAATGGPVRTVVEHDGASGDAAWSPDGRCIVFNGGRDEDETRYDLKAWCDDDSPTGVLRTLTDTPLVDERDPDWSPDGARIVFVAKSNEPTSTERWTAWTIRPDGTDRRQLLALPDRHVRFPRFDVQGERVGFIAARQNLPFGTLSVLDLTAQTTTPLCDLASDTWSWSPDGTEILFANIANSGVRLVEGPLSTVRSRHVLQRSELLSALLQAAVQYKGLYRVDVASRTIGRLSGPAGGVDAANVPTNFEFGFMPDWTAGTATPVVQPSATPTPPEDTPAPPPSPSVERPSDTPTAAPTRTTMPTTRPRHARVFLPRLFRAVSPPRRRLATAGANTVEVATVGANTVRAITARNPYFGWAEGSDATRYGAMSPSK